MNKNEFKMIRGDTETVEISLREAGEQVLFKEGDVVYFTVKKNIREKEYTFQAKITEFNNGRAIFKINPTDTRELDFGDYVYDVQLTEIDGTVTTIIPVSPFIIMGEVTDD